MYSDRSKMQIAQFNTQGPCSALCSFAVLHYMLQTRKVYCRCIKKNGKKMAEMGIVMMTVDS